MTHHSFSDDWQFYPTPSRLAHRAWEMFSSDVRRDPTARILEPSAGTGDLLGPVLDRVREWEASRFSWDAIEINPDHHAKLVSRHARVVGYDFLSFQGMAHYSHIIMNPPFNQGAKHLLHAWNGLFDGEIVAILNAETLRNPYSAERKLLARIVQEHGRVEYLQEAFTGEGVVRTAQVEVALIHLVKRADEDALVGNMIEGLVKDRGPAPDAGQWEPEYCLSVPDGFVEEVVYNFDLAVEAERQSAIVQARAAHYRKRMGKTMAEALSKGNDTPVDKTNSEITMASSLRYSFANSYIEMKDAAWSQILHSTYVLSRLSHKARKRVESEFENIKALEFTVANIYGFLRGLSMNAGDIQMGMYCDVFDLITRYHTDNAAYFMGWKSNDKHRTAGMRIKRSRFIIPSESHSYWRSSASWDMCSMLGDFDRVFALLDGKQAPAIGLRDLFETPESFKRLLDAERLSSDYFDVRYYKGIGTIHFYPKSPDVIERLNRVVGRHRSWLPSSMDEASSGFMAQYEMAEKLQKEVSKAFTSVERGANGGWYTLGGLRSESAETREAVNQSLCQALVQVLDAHGLQPFEALTGGDNPLLKLELAA